MSLFSIFNIASAGMSAQSTRLNLTASNLANANSIAGSSDEAYKARHPVFESVIDSSTQNPGMGTAEVVSVAVTSIKESNAAPQAQHSPGHPLADKDGYVYSSNVNPMDEMANMISASRSYQLNVEIMTASKKLLQNTLKIAQ